MARVGTSLQAVRGSAAHPGVQTKRAQLVVTSFKAFEYNTTCSWSIKGDLRPAIDCKLQQLQLLITGINMFLLNLGKS